MSHARTTMTIADLPAEVQALPAGLAVSWLIKFNAALEDGYDAEGAAAAAWAAVKLVREQVARMGDIAQGYALSNGGGRLLLFPRGTFKHPQYGTLDFDDDFFEEIQRNFRDKVLGATEPFIDLDHSHGAAAGWIKELTIEPEGMFARVAWTPLGEEAVRSQEWKYFSPWFSPYIDPETGKKYDRVLRGGGLTNVPFLKVLPPVALWEPGVDSEARRTAFAAAGVRLTELTRVGPVKFDAIAAALKELMEANEMNQDPCEVYAQELSSELARGASLNDAYAAIDRRHPSLAGRVANAMQAAIGGAFRWTEATPETRT